MTELTPARALVYEMRRWFEKNSPGWYTVEDFDTVLAETRREAWDEGFAAGVNADMGDYEHPPTLPPNPYRQETNND